MGTRILRHQQSTNTRKTWRKYKGDGGKVQEWMGGNELNPKTQTRRHRAVDFPGLESETTSINEIS